MPFSRALEIHVDGTSIDATNKLCQLASFASNELHEVPGMVLGMSHCSLLRSNNEGLNEV